MRARGSQRALALLVTLLCAPALAAPPRQRPPVLFVPPPAAIPRAEPAPAGAVPAAVPTEDGPAEPEAPAPSKRRKLRVTVFPFPEPGVGEDLTVSLLRSLSDALGRNERLDMRDLDRRLSDFAQEVPVDQLDLARATYERGTDALHKLQLGSAVAQLQEAVEQFVVVLPYIKKQELADAMLALAVAQAQKGNRRAANAALIRLLTWRSDYQLDTERFPPLISGPLEDARRAVARLARGNLRIQTDPPGAQVFVDGRYVGVTPAVAEGLLVGEHFVTFRKIGYKKGVRVAQVSSRSVQVVQAKLQQSDKYLLVKQAMDRLGRSLGAQRLDPVMDSLKETLYLDHAVFLQIAPEGSLPVASQPVAAGKGGLTLEPARPEGKLRVAAYLYDLRTRLRLTQHRQTFTPAEAELRMGELADRLYAQVDYDNILKPPPEPPPPPPVARQPLYKKWWFLTAMGAMAAGVAAIGVGVGVTRPQGCPEGNLCTGPIQY